VSQVLTTGAVRVKIAAAVRYHVASLYLYGRLAIPAGSRLFGSRSRHRKKWPTELQEIRREQGLLYTHMVWTWRWIFTPGVFFALAGFFAILLRNRNVYVVGGALVAILLPVGLYWYNQPPLGAD
jgi:hypothetical protein